MKIAKRIVSFMLSLALVLTLVSVAPAVTSEAASASVTITAPTKSSNFSVYRTTKDKTFQLKYKVSGGTKQSASFKSSNTAVATVTKGGKVTVKKAGTATITLTVKLKSGKVVKDTLKINVKQRVTALKASVKSTVKTNDGYYLVPVGKTRTIGVSYTPTKPTSKTVSYSAFNTKIATVSAKGVITGKKEGSTTITVKSKDGSNKTVKFKVKVVKPVSSVVINSNASTLNLITGKTATLNLTYSPVSSSAWGVKYTTSDSSIATVSSTGKVTAKKAGTVTITATANDGVGKKDTIKVVVTDPIKSISLLNPTVSLKTGSTSTINYTVNPTTASSSVVYESKDKTVATVSATGVITAVGRGTTTIRVTSATNAAVYNDVTVTVTDSVYTEVKVNAGTKVSLTINSADVAAMVTDLDSAAVTCKSELTALSGSDWTATVDGKVYTVKYVNGAFTYTDASGKDVKSDLAKATGKTATVVIPSTSNVDKILSAAESIQSKSVLGDAKAYNYTLTLAGATKSYVLKNLVVSKQYTTFVSGTTTYNVYVNNTTLCIKGDVTTGSNIFNDMKSDGIVTLTVIN